METEIFYNSHVARTVDQPELQSQFNDNSLMAGFDGWWFLDRRKNWVVSGWTAGTRIDGDDERIASVQTNSLHYFQRPDADEVRYDPTRTSLSGYGSRYWLNHQNGEFILNAAAGFMSPGFDVNDIGFMSRADVINYHVGGGWKWTKPCIPLRLQWPVASSRPILWWAATSRLVRYSSNSTP